MKGRPSENVEKKVSVTAKLGVPEFCSAFLRKRDFEEV
jgi:hypothetical protein